MRARASRLARDDNARLGPLFLVGKRKSARISILGVLPATGGGNGIGTALHSRMPTDFVTLLRRDHSDLQHELSQLLDPSACAEDLRMALDGVRLGLIAHAEAEDIVLGRLECVPALQVVLAQARAAHLAQEGMLSALVCIQPQTPQWRDCAQHLRELVEYHAVQEEKYLLPALRQHAPAETFAQLAGLFATERLRQLAMLQPSSPMMMAMAD